MLYKHRKRNNNDAKNGLGRGIQDIFPQENLTIDAIWFSVFRSVLPRKILKMVQFGTFGVHMLNFP